MERMWDGIKRRRNTEGIRNILENTLNTSRSTSVTTVSN